MIFLVSWALAADTAESVAAMPTASASDRLAQVIAARGLPASERETLTGLAPRVAVALDDPQVATALGLVLSLPPAEIGRARRGDTVVRSYGKWGEAEESALAELAKLLRFKGAVDAWLVRTEQAELVRVVLVKGKKEASATLVPPPAWSTPGSYPQDGSFENPRALGLLWTLREGDDVVGVDALASVSFRDEQRVKAGSASLRITPQGRDTVHVSQPLAVVAGQSLRVSVAAAGDGAKGQVALLVDGSPLASSDWNSAGGGSFVPLELAATVPDGATQLDLVLATQGPGSMNWDDVRVAVEGKGGGVTVTERGPLRLRHPGTESHDISVAAMEVSRAITVLKLPPEPPVTVDSTCADVALCAVELWVRRAWGAPSSDSVAAGVIDAALSRPSGYAEMLAREGAVGLRTAWREGG
ncbi:MAG: hypothetical protein FJ102_11710 [Deltaproteobacteria bacterium]|nr:hypothetical protein [Deltaproteobacteria bacterium]